jgi:(p)ppGpp synthase/HD superfamily hydrolase
LRKVGDYKGKLLVNENTENTAATLLRALRFAARKHRDQKRKGSDKAPYINHLISVAEVLASVGKVTDLTLLQAAILHDTIEDTGTKREELESEFGADVTSIVLELTDDNSLPKKERKQQQVEHAPQMSDSAKQLKIADKISNISEIAPDEPPDWTPERRREYLDWAERVVAGCRGVNVALEEHFDSVLAERRALGARASRP